MPDHVRIEKHPTVTLQAEFTELENALRQLIGLLTEAEERFWRRYLERGLAQVQDRKLSGATFVLGCFGGAQTFSDCVIGSHLEHDQPLHFENLNARLGELRTRVFNAANAITSRRSW